MRYLVKAVVVLAVLLCASLAAAQSRTITLSTTVKWDDGTAAVGSATLSRVLPSCDPGVVTCTQQLVRKNLSLTGFASFTLPVDRLSVYRVDIEAANGTWFLTGAFSFAVLDEASWARLLSAKDSLTLRLADGSKKSEQFTLRYAQ